MRTPTDKQPVIFRGNWLGGEKIDLEDTLACACRVTIQVPEYAFEAMKEMAKYTSKLGFIVNKYDLIKSGGKHNAHTEPPEGQEEHSDGKG